MEVKKLGSTGAPYWEIIPRLYSCTLARRAVMDLWFPEKWQQYWNCILFTENSYLYLTSRGCCWLITFHSPIWTLASRSKQIVNHEGTKFFLYIKNNPISVWLKSSLKRAISVQCLSNMHVGGATIGMGDTKTKIHRLYPSAYVLVRKEDI